MPNSSPPPHRPLGRTLAAAAGVIGFAFLSAVVLYFATEGLLYFRGNFVMATGHSFGARISASCQETRMPRNESQKPGHGLWWRSRYGFLSVKKLALNGSDQIPRGACGGARAVRAADDQLPNC